MTALYACRSLNPAEYSMTKFDADFNVQSSYTLTQEGCDCPQGHKPTCRHRKMLPAFAKEGHINDGWFLDWDTRQWRKPISLGQQELNLAKELGMPVDEPAELPSPISAVEGAPDVSQANAPSEGVEQQVVQASAAPPSPLPKRRKA